MYGLSIDRIRRNIKFQITIYITLCKAFLTVTCPLCGKEMHRHGYYQREVDLCGEFERIKILRHRCPSCRKTFAYLPNFLARYNSVTRTSLRAMVAAQKQGASLRYLAQQFTVSLQTMWRWLKRARAGQYVFGTATA